MTDIQTVHLLTETFKMYSWQCTGMLSLVFLITLTHYFYGNFHQIVCLVLQS